MDEMTISSNILRGAIGKIARRVISKKLGKNVIVNFPGQITVRSIEDGSKLKATFTVELTMSAKDIYDLLSKEE